MKIDYNLDVPHDKNCKPQQQLPICALMISVQTRHQNVSSSHSMLTEGAKDIAVYPKTIEQPSLRRVKMDLISQPNNAQACRLHHLQSRHHQSRYLLHLLLQILPWLSMYLSLQQLLVHFQTTAFQ